MFLDYDDKFFILFALKKKSGNRDGAITLKEKKMTGIIIFHFWKARSRDLKYILPERFPSGIKPITTSSTLSKLSLMAKSKFSFFDKFGTKTENL